MSDTCISHIEDHWKVLTTSTNDYFNKKNFEKALSGYKDAFYRAEILSGHVPDCIRLNIPFIQVYIISCNNLANTYEEMGKFEEAENMLKRIIYYLLNLAGNNMLNIDDIQPELKRATVNYIHFAEKINKGKLKPEKLFTVLKEQLLEKKKININ